MAMAAATSQRPLLPSAGRELLLDLKRSVAAHSGPTASTSSSNKSTSTTLPTYNTKLVQACMQSMHNEIQQLSLVVEAISRDNDNIYRMPSRPVVLLHHESVQRHKRCLLAYHYQRMQLLKDIVRQHKESSNDINTTSSLMETQNTATTAAKTTTPVSQNQHEVQFGKTYRELRANYAATVGIDLDAPMPVSNMVMIRVVTENNLGQVILPNSGRQVLLQAGATLFLERADAVDLLQQGVVQLCSKTEEVDF